MTLLSAYIQSHIAWILLLITLQLFTSSLTAAPIQASKPETQLITIEFALLQATDKTALTTEAWNSPIKIREQIQAELQRQNMFEQSYHQYPIKKVRSGKLITTLNRLLRRGQYSILYSSVWQQPKSQKRHAHSIAHPITDFEPYNFAYGKLKLEKRSTLVAQLDITILDTLSLTYPLTRQANHNPHNTALDIQETITQRTLTEQEASINTMISNEQPTPLIFLNQQRQIKPNKIHYFDHPVIPSFLLISI